MEYNYPEWYTELLIAINKFHMLVGNADLSDVPADVRKILYDAQSNMNHELVELILLRHYNQLPDLYAAQEKA